MRTLIILLKYVSNNICGIGIEKRKKEKNKKKKKIKKNDKVDFFHGNEHNNPKHRGLTKMIFH